MAMYISTTFGKIRGKFGDAVAYDRNGKQIIRRYVVPKNPRTEKQQIHRRKFAIVQSSLKVLREPISFGYGKKTDYCKAVSHAMNYAVKGFYTHQSIDYAQVQVSKGSLPKSFQTQVSIQGETLTLSWDTMFSPGKNTGDEVNVVLLSSSKGRAKLIHTGVTRSAGSISLHLPPSAPIGTFHVWIFFSNGEERSDSMYSGTVEYSIRKKRDVEWSNIVSINDQKQKELAKLEKAYHHIRGQFDSKCRDIPLVV
jgi:hypothetical protein